MYNKKKGIIMVVSIIVPIYNIEAYVGRCIESIINQQYRNIEIILVDDGSVDHSGDICDMYAQKDSRIKVIHKTNGGRVSARKSGAVVATGDYIINVDGDDWIEKAYISNFVSAIKKRDCDVVWGISYIKEQNQHNELQIPIFLKNVTVETEEMQEKCLQLIKGNRGFQNEIDYSICLQCTRREVYISVQKEVDCRISRGEDLILSLFLINKTNNIFFIRNDGYHYVQRSTSLTHNKASYSWNEYMILKNALSKYMIKYISLYNIAQGYLVSTYMAYFFGSLQDESKEYLYPFLKVKKNSRVAIYGAGNIGENIVSYLNNSNDYQMCIWIDRNKSDKKIGKWQVKPIEQIVDVEFDFIILATNRTIYIGEMWNMVKKLGVQDEKIASAFDNF